MDPLSVSGIFGKAGGDMKKRMKGSMTVEAAFIVPVILMVIFALILLTMYVHNRAWYTAVSAEAVISASTEGTRSRQNAQKIAAEKLAERKGKQGFPSGEIAMTAAAGSDYIKAQTRISGRKVAGMGDWEARIEEKSSFIKPVFFIRNLMALEAWKEE